MAFPSIRSQSTYEGSGEATTFDMPYPATISAGDTLVWVMGTYDDGTSVTTPTGFTALGADPYYNASTRHSVHLWYKEAAGTESGNETVTLGASENACCVMYCIQDAIDPDTQAPEVGTAATGNAATHTPNSLSPTGGAKDYLWIAFCSHHPTSTLNNYPTSYSLGQVDLLSTSTKVMHVAAAARQLNAASEASDGFDYSATADGGAGIIAVHPVAAAGGSASLAGSTLTNSILTNSGLVK